jgi:hypothetical protein
MELLRLRVPKTENHGVGGSIPPLGTIRPNPEPDSKDPPFLAAWRVNNGQPDAADAA